MTAEEFREKAINHFKSVCDKYCKLLEEHKEYKEKSCDCDRMTCSRCLHLEDCQERINNLVYQYTN